jgi:hypothetical protein
MGLFADAVKVWGIQERAMIYTIFGSTYTTFGLGVCYTGYPGWPEVSAGLTGLPGQAFRPAC